MPVGHLTIGNGEDTVLMLPDWFGGSSYLAGLGHHIDNDRYRYIVVDYRGYGSSIDREGAFTIAEMAADAVALVDSLAVDRFHLVGHSMGGKVAQLIAARQAERLKSVVAITPTPPIALEFDADTRALLEDCAENIESRKIALNVATGSQYGTGFIANLASISMGASRPSAYRAYLDAWSQTDIREEIGASSFPLHVIIGAQDPFVPEDAIRSNLEPSFPNLRLTILEGLGHYPLLEAPPRTVELMETEFAKQS